MVFIAAKSYTQWMGNNVYGTSTPFHVSIKKNELVLFQLTWESFQECFELKM